METYVYRSISSSLRGARRAAAALIVCALLVSVPMTSHAATAGETTKKAGLGAASALASLVYAPAKLVYAVGGLIIGGLAWTFSGGDNEVARVVMTPSVLGDYVITPRQLLGEDPIEFVGRDLEYQVDALDVAAAPPLEPDAQEELGW